MIDRVVTDEPEAPAIGVLVERLRATIGVVVEPGALRLEWREWRWMALLPSHVVFVAASEAGWRRLGREAKLMAAARAVVGPQIPEVLWQDAAPRLQVRPRMSGLHGHEIERRILGVMDGPMPSSAVRSSPECPWTPWGVRFAHDLGRALARLHGAMTAAEGRAIGLVSYRPEWEEIERALHGRPGLDSLRRAAPLVRAWDEARAIEDVVVHGDPHLHNMFATHDGRLASLIDFGDAAVGDRHEDLRYLCSQGPRFTRVAMDAYEEESGVAVDPRVVARLHVRSALEHFSWVEPHARRFPEIVEWATAALETLTPEWAVAPVGR